jgi:hypothetical protein
MASTSKDEVILALEKENKELKEENEALKKWVEFARGAPVVALVAEWTKGVLTKYKDSYDIETKSGMRLEVKWSKCNPTRSSTKRWVWNGILGLNRMKDFQFLVLAGEKDPRYKARYPNLPYVFFLVPRSAVNNVKGGNSVGFSTNPDTVWGAAPKRLKPYLVHSQDEFGRFMETGTFLLRSP